VNRFRSDHGIMLRGCTLAIAAESPSADLLLKVSMCHLTLPKHRASLLQTGRMLFSTAQVISHIIQPLYEADAAYLSQRRRFLGKSGPTPTTLRRIVFGPRKNRWSSRHYSPLRLSSRFPAKKVRPNGRLSVDTCCSKNDEHSFTSFLRR
jgi:hypothetical protein